MTDIENKVFNTVAVALQTLFPGIAVYGEYLETPEVFPCVTIEEADNYVPSAFLSTTNREYATDLMYSVNVYTNNVNGRKSEAKKIADAIDEQFTALGFRRSLRNQTPNIDRSKYRITMRYVGRVTTHNTAYAIYNR